MFETASRLKLRFDTSKGQLAVEDLWDLPLTSNTGKANLDDVARGLHRQLKNGDDVSFVERSQKSDEMVQLKFDIVKHVIDVRLAENDAAALARSNKEKKQQIQAIIAQKENESLMGASLEELKRIADSL
jgi:hypothetical protein